MDGGSHRTGGGQTAAAASAGSASPLPRLPVVALLDGLIAPGLEVLRPHAPARREWWEMSGGGERRRQSASCPSRPLRAAAAGPPASAALPTPPEPRAHRRAGSCSAGAAWEAACRRSTSARSRAAMIAVCARCWERWTNSGGDRGCLGANSSTQAFAEAQRGPAPHRSSTATGIARIRGSLQGTSRAASDSHSRNSRSALLPRPPGLPASTPVTVDNTWGIA